MARFITFLVSILSMTMASAENYYFKHLGVADGLSQVTISTIYQDELGAIWLGTTEGLNRYNGKDVKVFRPSLNGKGLTKNEVHDICGDKNGSIYIRTGYDLIKLDIYKEEFTCLRQNDVKGIYCKGDTLWVACKTDIYYYIRGNSDLTFVTRLQDGEAEGIYVDETFLRYRLITLGFLGINS